MWYYYHIVKEVAIMKPTSVIRELDHYGRLVIPSEMRRVLGQSDDEKIRVEIYTLDNICKSFFPCIQLNYLLYHRKHSKA